MGRGASSVYFVRHLLKALLRERETVAFPAGEPDIPTSYQGQVAIDIAHCRGCGLCVRACPAAAIELASLPDRGLCMAVYHDRCACCGVCEMVCPAGAIRREPAFRPGATQREALREEWRRESQRTPC